MAEEIWLEDMLNSFSGGRIVYSFADLIKHLENISENVDEKLIRSMIATLVNLGFLGIKVGGRTIEYATDIQVSQKLMSLIKNTNRNTNFELEIHPVFHHYLNSVAPVPQQHNNKRFPWLKY